MIVKQLLSDKRKGFWSVSPDTSAYDAVQLMIEHDVGALIVMEGEQVAGIVTERDYVRRLTLSNRTAKDTLIRDIMTPRVIVMRPDQTVEECMTLMTEKQVRHIPVVEDGHVLGIISIRDVVRHVLANQEFMIEQLENYITDRPSYKKGS